MSFLDIDERLLVLADKVDVVYSPVVDPKEFPEDVDVTLVEGAVSSHHDLEKAQLIRERIQVRDFARRLCRDRQRARRCGTPMRSEALFRRAYVENGTWPQTAEAPAGVACPC